MHTNAAGAYNSTRKYRADPPKIVGSLSADLNSLKYGIGHFSNFKKTSFFVIDCIYMDLHAG